MLSKTRIYLGISETKWLLAFFSTLFVGLLLRIFSLDHGLPWVVGPDEGFEIHRALKLGLGQIDLERAGKGGLYYLLFIEYGIYYLFLLLSGKVNNPHDFATLFDQDPSMFWILGRFTVMILSLLIIFMTYKIGQKFFSVTVGLIGMALIAVSPEMVENSQYINVDTPMSLLALIIVYLCLNAITEKKINSVTWGAVLAVAVMTKLPAILLFIPMLVAYWYVNQDLSLIRKLGNIQVIYFGLSFLLIYAVTNPAGVVVYGTKIGTILGIYTSQTAVDPDHLLINAGASVNLWAYYVNVLLNGFGLTALMTGLVGIVLMLVKQRRKAIILMSFPLALFIAIAGTSSTHLYYSRYMVPIFPFLALFAAFLITYIATQVGEKIGRQKSMVISLVIVASCFILVAPPLVKSYQWTTKFLKQHTSEVAMHWIEDNVDPGTAILLKGNPVRRQSLVVPLSNIASNYDVLIEEMKNVSPVKARYLELQKTSPHLKRYDLHTFRFFEPIASVDSYVAKGVSIFIINRNLFASENLKYINKFSNEVNESRNLFYQDLQDNERFEKVFDISPELENRIGSHIEIYKLKI